MRIKTKILSLSAAFAVGLAGLTSLGVNSILGYGEMVGKLDRTHVHAFMGERLNGIVTSIVADSRGIYASADTKTAASYAQGIRERLDEMNKLLAEWGSIADDGDAAELAKVKAEAAEFARFRTELARLGAEVSPVEANNFGNNDENRAN